MPLQNWEKDGRLGTVSKCSFQFVLIFRSAIRPNSTMLNDFFKSYISRFAPVRSTIRPQMFYKIAPYFHKIVLKPFRNSSWIVPKLIKNRSGNVVIFPRIIKKIDWFQTNLYKSKFLLIENNNKKNYCNMLKMKYHL